MFPLLMALFAAVAFAFFMVSTPQTAGDVALDQGQYGTDAAQGEAHARLMTQYHSMMTRYIIHGNFNSSGTAVESRLQDIITYHQTANYDNPPVGDGPEDEAPIVPAVFLNASSNILNAGLYDLDGGYPFSSYYDPLSGSILTFTQVDPTPTDLATISTQGFQPQQIAAIQNAIRRENGAILNIGRVVDRSGNLGTIQTIYAFRQTGMDYDPTCVLEFEFQTGGTARGRPPVGAFVIFTRVDNDAPSTYAPIGACDLSSL